MKYFYQLLILANIIGNILLTGLWLRAERKASFYQGKQAVYDEQKPIVNDDNCFSLDKKGCK